MHRRKWLGRVLIGTVLFINVQCALLFLLQPRVYVPGFGLEGGMGIVYVRGIGLLFLMWNVPYFRCSVGPNEESSFVVRGDRHADDRFGGRNAAAAEFTSRASGASQHSVRRFILFDAVGLVLLLLAVWVTRVTNECEKPIVSSS